MSVQNTTKAKDYKELYSQYNWFSNAYPPAIQEASDEFFLPEFKIILVGICKNINTFTDKNGYFVTKVKIDKLHDMFFRLSENTVEIILDRILGHGNGKFNLNKLTDLEAKVITSFNDYMYNKIGHFFVTPPPSIKRTNFDVIHLNFLLKDIKNGKTGKLILTLPEVLLAPSTIKSEKEIFNEIDFSTSEITAKLKIGTTKFKLIEIKNLNIDDIVVFDNSDIEHMTLNFKNYEKELNLNPNLGLTIPYDYNEEGDNIMAENLWDSIEVEMSATFDKVKISLKELKNIEQGLVVDLTSIYDNKVTLSVEDKPIARGELVIVNDRYGVKISEVLAEKSDDSVDESDEIQPAENIIEEPAEELNEEITEPQEQQDDDEFDYSDFELEDEDI